MPRRTTTYWLVKIARISGWLLLVLMLVYIVTGFALCGEYGLERLVSYQLALEIHKVFEWPLVVVFLTHASVTIYFAFRRWGWIGRPGRIPRAGGRPPGRNQDWPGQPPAGKS
ncbi:MAG: hypothetical protein ACUVUC_16070 [Thermoguttaceae bacterium]